MSRNAAIEPRTVRAAGMALAALAVLLHGVLLVRRYPAAYLDSDLLSYLTFYRDLRAGTPLPFGYTVPKVLPVLMLGPLADPARALWLSVAVAAAGGAMVFALALDAFGLATAVVATGAYVLDPLRAVLTLRSSVDLYVGVALLAAIVAMWHRAVGRAAILILVAALGKPVAAVCGLAILSVPGIALGRRCVLALLPALAAPANALLAAVLAGGNGLGLAQLAVPGQFASFLRISQGHPLGAQEIFTLIFMDWLRATLFVHTWPLVLAGAALYLASRRSLASAEGPARGVDQGALLLLVPALLCAGYAAFAIVQPLVVFIRFFWLLEVIFAVFAAHAAVRLARMVPVSGALQTAFLAALALVLAADLRANQERQDRVMLLPIEVRADLAEHAIATIAEDRECAGPAVVPLEYLSLAAWRAPSKLARGELCAAEDWADGRGCRDPRCVLLMPDMPITERARQAMGELVKSGYTVEVGNEFGALVRATDG
ncbi:MAG TPA: hypothetical protein VEI94_01400 [Candidatus Bathyarchaeia archaeon]|nr:hypothetical protein [Candidatus Bathyarchaeia archaeon]